MVVAQIEGKYTDKSNGNAIHTSSTTTRPAKCRHFTVRPRNKSSTVYLLELHGTAFR